MMDGGGGGGLKLALAHGLCRVIRLYVCELLSLINRVLIVIHNEAVYFS